MRLLLVDDDPEDRFLLKRAISRSELGAVLFEASTLAKATDLLLEISPDCLLVDYRLPDGNGLALLKVTKRPLILMTGHGDEALAVDAMKSGAADYFPKDSITPVRLQQSISAAIEKAELQNRLARYQEDLEQRNKELEYLNKQKDRFFSIISHDLRTPFNGLVGISELMMQQGDRLSANERDMYAAAVHQSAKELLTLLENLLEWSRVQMNAVQFTPLETSLKHIVEAAFRIVRRAAVQKSVRLVNCVDDQRVRVDAEMMTCVLRNLIANAVKFSTAGGQVIVTAQLANGCSEVTVSDTGVGMPPSLVGRLFKLDEKVSMPGTDGETGTGLGLLLCKELVEKHGGRITVDSREGEGTAFRFTIPAC